MATLQQQIDGATAGTTLTLTPGTYRESAVVNKALTVDGNDAVVIKGSDDWSIGGASGCTWSGSGPYTSSLAVPSLARGSNYGWNGSVDTALPLGEQTAAARARCYNREQLFVDGVQYVNDPDDTASPAAGHFSMRSSDRRLVIPINPSGHLIEVSVRDYWLNVTASNVTVKNLTGLHSSSARGTHGITVTMGLTNCIVEYCDLSYGNYANVGYSNTAGSVGAGCEIRHNVIHHAGALGVFHGGVLSDNDIHHNNVRVWGVYWEAAGVKTGGDAGTWTGNAVHDNACNGLWVDELAQVTISGNKVHHNDAMGIQYEVSSNGHIDNNKVWRNAWLFGNCYGICVNQSGTTEINLNDLYDNAIGIGLEISQRDAGHPAPNNIWAHDNNIVQLAGSSYGMDWYDQPASWTGVNANDCHYYFPAADGTGTKWRWGTTTYNLLATWQTIAGGWGSTYLTTTDRDNMLAAFNKPWIMGVRVRGVQSTSVTIKWYTDTASSSQVEYGLTTGYGQTTTLDATPVTTHSVTVSGLQANTPYHFRVRSTDSGGLTLGSDGTFTTAVGVGGGTRSATITTALQGTYVAALPQFPTMLVEVAFTSNPTDAVQTWSDVTAYVQSFNTRRGRATELDQFQPGTATVTLKNQDRRFDPAYPASPYSPNVKIGKRLRISAIWNGVTYRVWDGYIDAWPQSWQNQRAAQVVVTATDAFKRFNLFPLNGDYSNVVMGSGPWGYWTFDGNANDTSGNNNVGTPTGAQSANYTGGWPGGTAPGTAKYFGTDDIVTHGTTGWATGGLSIEFWLYAANWTANDGIVHGFWQSHASTNFGAPAANQVVIAKGGSNDLAFQVATPSAVSQYLSVPISSLSGWNYLVATASPSAGLQWYLNGLPFGSANNVGTLIMPTSPPPAPRWGQGWNNYLGGAYLAHCAIYPTRLAADQVYDRWKSYQCWFVSQDSNTRVGAALDVLRWPANDRDFDGGAATLSAGWANESLLSYLQKINNSEVGRLFMGADNKVRFVGRDATLSPPYTDSQATFGDGTNELPYTDIQLSYDDSRVWNEVRLKRVNGTTTQVARDPTLQVTDIVRKYEDASLLHSTDAQTLAAAQYRLAQYKQAVLRVDGMSVAPRGNPNSLWPQVLGREIGDRVTVVRRPQQMGSMSQQVYIEGIEHQATASAEWKTTYTLSLADVTTFWLMGDTSHSTGGVWDGIALYASQHGMTTLQATNALIADPAAGRQWAQDNNMLSRGVLGLTTILSF